jgi:hypothetical protein
LPAPATSCWITPSTAQARPLRGTARTMRWTRGGRPRWSPGVAHWPIGRL